MVSFPAVYYSLLIGHLWRQEDCSFPGEATQAAQRRNWRVETARQPQQRSWSLQSTEGKKLQRGAGREKDSKGPQGADKLISN